MNTQTNDGGAAFPVPPDRTNVVEGGNIHWSYAHPGMTLRDYFAAAALQGMLAYYHGYGSFYAAGSAYQYADAMLAERNRVAQKET